MKKSLKVYMELGANSEYGIVLDLKGIGIEDIKRLHAKLYGSGISRLESEDEITLMVYGIASEYGFDRGVIEVIFR